MISDARRIRYDALLDSAAATTWMIADELRHEDPAISTALFEIVVALTDQAGDLIAAVPHDQRGNPR